MHVRLWSVPSDSTESIRHLRPGPWLLNSVGAATRLIPIPGSIAGVVILGETAISYSEMSPAGEHKVVTIQVEQTHFVTYTLIDERDGRRILVGDYRGGLYLLTLDRARASGSASLAIARLGDTVVAQTLSYLDNGFVYIGSLSGDAQLIQLGGGGGADGEAKFSVVDSYQSLGQATDFVVVEQEKQGQGQIVACCGTLNDGSLRVMCNGVGVNETAIMPMTGLKGVWSLSLGSQSGYVIGQVWK